MLVVVLLFIIITIVGLATILPAAFIGLEGFAIWWLLGTITIGLWYSHFIGPADQDYGLSEMAILFYPVLLWVASWALMTAYNMIRERIKNNP